jgi:tetratricopeptide (TPR) repeat protein
VSAHRPRNRVLLLTLGPVVGAAVGTITNLLTSHWNWWLFSILTVLVAVTAVAAVVLDRGGPNRPGYDDKSRSEEQASSNRRCPANVNTLPRGLEDFTGRQDELARLVKEIDAARPRPGMAARVISIEGMGGVGKTSLAVRIAHQIAPSYPDAVLFINLRAHMETQEPISTAEVLGILLADLGVPGDSIPDELEGRVSVWRRELAGARVLLVLDNASGPDQVENLLAGGPGCLILVTSRRRLVELEGVSSLSLSTFPPDDAVTLFERVLGRERAPGQRTEIARAVRRLGYLPLAIRLAAARLKAHPTWTVGDLLERDIRNETSLERIYTLSYRDLDPRLKTCFRLLSIHPGTEITSEAAAVLTGMSLRQVLGVLDELYNWHLIEEPAHHRFQFHDLIKEFATREVPGMSNDSERTQALRRLLGYYAFMATVASERIGTHDVYTLPAPIDGPELRLPEDETAALGWFEAELANLLACAYYASDQKIVPSAWQIPAAMMSFLRLRGFLGQAVSVLEAALQATLTESDHVGESVVRRRLGQLARLQGDYRRSRDQLNQSLRLAKELDDRKGVAWGDHELGHLDRLTGNPAAARGHLEEALTIFRELDDRRGEGSAATNMALALRADGDLPAAREYFQEALRIAREFGEHRPEAFAGYQLGALECESGSYAQARELLIQALAIYDGVRNLHGQADCHYNLAVVDRLTGEYEAAKGHLTEALNIYVELRYQRGEADTYSEFAATADAAGDAAMSLVHHQRAATIYAEMGLSQP